jgi:hypothetical protein
VVKETLKRSVVLFAASLGGTVIAASAVWWHHTSLVESCDTLVWRNGEPVTCFYSTTFFADWSSLAMLALVYFVLCFVIACLWGLAKRRSAQAAR